MEPDRSFPEGILSGPHMKPSEQCWAYNKTPRGWKDGSVVKTLALRAWPPEFRPQDPHKKQDVMASIRIPSLLPWQDGRWRQRLTRKLVGQLAQRTWSSSRNNQTVLQKIKRKELTPRSCPLTSTHAPWHAPSLGYMSWHTHTYTHS